MFRSLNQLGERVQYPIRVYTIDRSNAQSRERRSLAGFFQNASHIVPLCPDTSLTPCLSKNTSRRKLLKSIPWSSRDARVSRAAEREQDAVVARAVARGAVERARGRARRVDAAASQLLTAPAVRCTAALGGVVAVVRARFHGERARAHPRQRIRVRPPTAKTALLLVLLGRKVVRFLSPQRDDDDDDDVRERRRRVSFGFARRRKKKHPRKKSLRATWSSNE